MTGSPLKSEIGLVGALSIGVGGMIGPAIFSNPRERAAHFGVRAAPVLRDRRGRCWSGCLWLRRAREGVPKHRGRRHVLGSRLRRGRDVRFAQRVPILQLHHHDRAVRHRVRGLRRDVHRPAGQGLGSGRRALVHGDQLPRRPDHGPSRVRDRDHQSGDPGRVHRGSVHRAPRERAGAAVAGHLARRDPTRATNPAQAPRPPRSQTPATPRTPHACRWRASSRESPRSPRGDCGSPRRQRHIVRNARE